MSYAVTINPVTSDGVVNDAEAATVTIAGTTSVLSNTVTLKIGGVDIDGNDGTDKIEVTGAIVLNAAYPLSSVTAVEMLVAASSAANNTHSMTLNGAGRGSITTIDYHLSRLAYFAIYFSRSCFSALRGLRIHSDHL